MKFINKHLIFLLSLAYSVLLFTSCTSNKNLAYFKNVPDSIKNLTIPTTEYKPILIKKDDILSVNIQTIDPSVTSGVNQQSSVSSALANTSGMGNLGQSNQQGAPPTGGFLVDNEGYIQLPVLGRIKVVGLTTSAAKDSLQQLAAKYYKEPTVSLRFANFRVSVLGEVNKPSVYTFPNEKISILDALSYAGDLTAYGKRKDVLLIREDENTGNKQFIKMDLNSTDFFKSPYFYLKQNDMIYVPPSKSKEVITDVSLTRTIAFMTPITSILIVLISRIKF